MTFHKIEDGGLAEVCVLSALLSLLLLSLFAMEKFVVTRD